MKIKYRCMKCEGRDVAHHGIECKKQIHTPGPWTYDGVQFIFSKDNDMVAEMRGFGADLPQDANGRLIAAAPGLLTALEEIRNQLVYIGLAGTVKAIRATCDKAIASAKGGSK